MKTRSSGSTNVCIFRHTLTWSNPAFERESDAMTKPSRVITPTQYVTSPASRLESVDDG